MIGARFRSSAPLARSFLTGQVHSRGVAVAALVKSLEADQKAIAAAISALGPVPVAKAKAAVAADPALAEAMAKVKAAEGDLSWTWSRAVSSPQGKPIDVALLGAGGAVGAAAAMRIAAGEMLGPSVPINLKVSGGDADLIKELEACAFPLLSSVSSAADSAAVKGSAFVLDLSGKADVSTAGEGTLVGVMGAKAAGAAAAKAKKALVTGITCVPQMQAEAAIAAKTGVAPLEVSKVVVWGEDVVDISSATAGGGWAVPMVGEEIELPPATPAMVAEAAVAHMKSLALGSDGEWISMAVPAVGDYGMGEGFFYSVPVTCEQGKYNRVGNIPITPKAAAGMEKARVALS